MGKAVSVIVPVYNGEKRVRECLKTLLVQTLADMEIVIIDDASTDATPIILQEYQKAFPEKIKVIFSKENRGAGGARNLGIDAAEGQYIGFVDSDDLVEPTMFEHLYQVAIQGDYDLTDAGYYMQSKDMAIVHTTDDMCGEMDAWKRQQLIVGGGYIVSKLFHRRLFGDGNLRFRHNVILEDADFLAYLYCTVHSVGNLKELVYYYRDVKDSSSHVSDTVKYYENIYAAMESIWEKVHGLQIYPEVAEAFEYELLQMYSYGVNVCIKGALQGEAVDGIRYLSNLRKLRMKVIQNGYENRYVRAKIGPADIDLMKENDRSPQELWEKYRNHRRK